MRLLQFPRLGGHFYPVLAILAAGSAFAGEGTWTGEGPFPPGADSRTVNALALDPETGTLHAGTSSGTVFQFSDSSFSQPPVAADDSAATGRDEPVTIDVLANDADPEGALDETSVTIRSAPANGTATANTDGTITYEPNSGFSGEDGFTYTVADAAGAESNEATVKVKVNSAPTADDQTVLTPQDTAVGITLTGSDPDGDAIGFAIASGPSSGILSGTPPDVAYEPDTGFVGNDSFTFDVCDPQPLCDTGTISLTVEAEDEVNGAPVANDQSVSTTEDAPVNITLTASDPEGDPLAFTITSGPSSGALSGVPPEVTYTPDTGFAGSDSFTFEACDPEPLCDTGTATIEVAAEGSEVTVTTLGAGGMGSVTSDPPGIDCPGQCSAVFPAGTEVTLKADPSPGGQFGGWLDCPAPQGDECVLTTDSSLSVSAQFLALAIPLLGLWGAALLVAFLVLTGARMRQTVAG